MKFMIMVFGELADLKARPPEWSEHMTDYMARLDDELAHSGELVYAEVLEYGSQATLVDRHGGRHRGSFSGTTKPLARFWVVKVPSEDRAIAIAAGLADVLGAAVEVRHVLEGYQRP